MDSDGILHHLFTLEEGFDPFFSVVTSSNETCFKHVCPVSLMIGRDGNDALAKAGTLVYSRWKMSSYFCARDAL